ncbi:MAG: GIY-YIG nuclease family protein [Bacteroidetes bacterium]|nr:GIY-YIG nuclease family protein [Bacteroidota bacterium]
MKYYIYIIYNPVSKKYYVGQSNDPWKRLIQHNESTKEKYTG